MSNNFHSFIISFNLNLESNERLLSWRRKTLEKMTRKAFFIETTACDWCYSQGLSTSKCTLGARGVFFLLWRDL